MGYRGKIDQQARARELRATGHTMAAIAADLGVSRSSVSLWTRDVMFEPRPRARARRREPNALQRRRAAEIAAGLERGRDVVGALSVRDLLIAGAALYAGEGSKRDGMVNFTNSDPRMIRLFCAWLRTHFDIDERRVRARLYLHEGLDYEAAVAYWSAIAAIPPSQFSSPYRAAADPTIRSSKHEFGCLSVRYSCSTTHRAVMGLVEALLS